MCGSSARFKLPLKYENSINIRFYLKGNYLKLEFNLTSKNGSKCLVEIVFEVTHLRAYCTKRTFASYPQPLGIFNVVSDIL